MLVRRSGLGAEARVKSIFEKKGVNGVLEEIDLLGGDYARRLYFVALVDLRTVRLQRRQASAGAVAQRMTSDYDRRQVLRAHRLAGDARSSRARRPTSRRWRR